MIKSRGVPRLFCAHFPATLPPLCRHFRRLLFVYNQNRKDGAEDVSKFSAVSLTDDAGWFFGAGAGQFTPAPMQRSQRGPDWLFVPFVKDAAGVAVPPGQTVWIMAQNEPAFAVRAADPTGVATTKFYRFEEFDPAAETVPASNFVTREEFDTVVKQFSAFLKEMGYESAV